MSVKPTSILISVIGLLCVLIVVPALSVTASRDVDRTPALADALFTLEWYTEGDAINDEVGFAVSYAGDINGDNYDDVIIGAPHDTDEVYKEGVAYVHYGTPGGPNDVPAWTVGSGRQGSLFGCAVGTAGDVNGDTYVDVIVGAKDYNNGTTKAGGAFVFYGSSLFGLSETPDWEVVSDQGGAYLGTSVGTAGDVNDDDYDDVVIGASRYTNGQAVEGQVLVFFGATDGLTTTNRWTFESDQANALFGTSVSAAGDVNCDGWDDIIVGSPEYDHGETDEGAAFVFYGATDGISTTYTILDGNQAEAQFGMSVSAAGDVNNDGCGDVIIGAPSYNGIEDNEGAAFIFLGSSDGVSTTPQRVIVSGAPGSRFGAAVGTAGDANSDGYDDVIVGAPIYTGDQSDEGAAFVYLGSTSGVGASAVWHGEGDKNETEFGYAVGTAGDVTGDNRVDLIIGAPKYRNQTDIRGRAFFYEGTGELPVLDKFVYLPLVMR